MHLGVPFLRPIILRGVCFSIGFERAQSAASPACDEVGGCGVLVIAVPQLAGEFEEGTEQGCAVIVGEFDEAGFLDEAAELDQVAGARAPVLDPLSFVVAGLGTLDPGAQHGHPLKLRRCCLQVVEQCRRRREERELNAERAVEHRGIARRNGEALLVEPEIALRALTQQHSTFSKHDLVRFLSRHTDGAEQFATVMAKVEASPELAFVGQDGL